MLVRSVRYKAWIKWREKNSIKKNIQKLKTRARKTKNTTVTQKRAHNANYIQRHKRKERRETDYFTFCRFGRTQFLSFRLFSSFHSNVFVVRTFKPLSISFEIHDIDFCCFLVSFFRPILITYFFSIRKSHIFVFARFSVHVVSFQFVFISIFIGLNSSRASKLRKKSTVSRRVRSPS